MNTYTLGRVGVGTLYLVCFVSSGKLQNSKNETIGPPPPHPTRMMNAKLWMVRTYGLGQFMWAWSGHLALVVADRAR